MYIYSIYYRRDGVYILYIPGILYIYNIAKENSKCSWGTAWSTWCDGYKRRSHGRLLICTYEETCWRGVVGYSRRAACTLPRRQIQKRTAAVYFWEKARAPAVFAANSVELCTPGGAGGDGGCTHDKACNGCWPWTSTFLLCRDEAIRWAFVTREGGCAAVDFTRGHAKYWLLW